MIEVFMNGRDMTGIDSHDAYARYSDFCKEHGFDAMDFRRFIHRLCSGWNYTTKQTNGGRILIPRPEDVFDKGLANYLAERTADMFDGMDTEEVHGHYKATCERDDYPILSRVEFSRRMCKALDMGTKQISVDGHRLYVFAID